MQNAQHRRQKITSSRTRGDVTRVDVVSHNPDINGTVTEAMATVLVMRAEWSFDF